MSLPALVVLLFALGVMERAYRKIRRQKKTGTPISGVAFDEFNAFIYGTKRVELDQRATQSLMREEEESGAPPNQVDLDNGIVILKPRQGDAGK